MLPKNGHCPVVLSRITINTISPVTQSQIGENYDSFSVTNESEVSFMDQDEFLFLTLNND